MSKEDPTSVKELQREIARLRAAELERLERMSIDTVTVLATTTSALAAAVQSVNDSRAEQIELNDLRHELKDLRAEQGRETEARKAAEARVVVLETEGKTSKLGLVWAGLGLLASGGLGALALWIVQALRAAPG